METSAKTAANVEEVDTRCSLLFTFRGQFFKKQYQQTDPTLLIFEDSIEFILDILNRLLLLVAVIVFDVFN